MRIRTKKLIMHSLQLKLVGTFIAVACVAALFQVAVLNYSVMGMIKESPEASEALAGRLSGVLTKNVVITLGVLMPVMFGVGVMVTHRVAGPAYAIENYLRKLGTGERPERPCRIRTGDELQTLCDAVNVAVNGMIGGPSPAEQTETVEPEGQAQDPPSLVADDEPVEEEAHAESTAEANAGDDDDTTSHS